MDQRGPGIRGWTCDVCWGSEQRVEHELELSTGFVVGFCYHTAADLRVCQAAHSLSCVRSCSAFLHLVQTEQLPEILNQRLTVPLLSSP